MASFQLEGADVGGAALEAVEALAALVGEQAQHVEAAVAGRAAGQQRVRLPGKLGSRNPG